ncbi:PPE domain-containing protein [Nocardia testacea]|uniref:PPE domain-containing protein n=1 Tax=Nocardia testacea TaxID=248551 RepID=UPI003C2B1D7B
MIETPEEGFTGVVWEARPADRLARDLTSGAGSASLSDAVAAWARLGAEFGTAALDYDRIVARLRQAWRSDIGTVTLDRLTVVRDWLLDAAHAGAANATRMGEHIAIYEAAALAMPHPEELATLAALQEAVTGVGTALGAPLVAIADDTENQQDSARSHAARVMRTYETASEPLATPWRLESPPVIASDTALHAEHAARDQSGQPPISAAPGHRTAVFPRLPIPPMTREPAPYRATHVPQPAPASSSPAPAPAGSHADTGSGRMLPASAAAPTTAATDEERSSAGRTAQYSTDPADLTEPIPAAPAVLGAADRPIADNPPGHPVGAS